MATIRGLMRQNFLCLLALCLALMLLIGGCDPKSLPGGLPNTGVPQDGVSQTIPFITGQLVNGTGQPVAGATVRAYVAPYRIEGLSTEPAASVEATTDAQGAFKLVSPPLGSVAVEARGSGQKALRTGVSVAQGAKVDLGVLSLQPTGRIAGRVTTSTGTNLLATDVFIPGTDYLAKTASDGSYSLQDVPVGVYQLAAVRNNFQPRVLEGVQVLANKVTEPPDLQLSLDAPVLVALNPESGGPGTVVTLTGTNFGASKYTSFQVTFNDTLAVTSRRISDTEIQATVPIGATTGAVVIRSNGVASEARPFQVISRLSLVPSSVGLYPGTAFAFNLQAFNDRGELVPSPFVAWALQDPTLGTISAQGTFQATREGVTELVARSGMVNVSAWVGSSHYRVTTLFGNGIVGNAGDGGLARLASFDRPYALAMDASGSLYVAGASTIIRRISPDGIVSRFAGVDGGSEASGDEGTAVDAHLGTSIKIAIDDLNRLWVSDAGNHIIRFIPLDDRNPSFKAGHIYRAVGTGSAGYSGPGLPGAQTGINRPGGVFPTAAGVYFADEGNHRIRLIAPDFRVLNALGTGLTPLMSQPTPQGEADISNPIACAVDERGNMVIGCRQQLLFWCRVAGFYFGRSMQAGWVYPLAEVVPQIPFTGDSASSQSLKLNGIPHSFWFDGEGGCWFLENCLVRRLTPQGRIETLAGKALEAAHRQVFGFDGEGANALVSSIGEAADLLVGGGQVFLADSHYSRIRRLEHVD